MFKKASIDGSSFIYGSRNTKQQGLTAYQGFNEEIEKEKKIFLHFPDWLKLFLDFVSCTCKKCPIHKKYSYTTIVRHDIYTSLLIINDLILTFH